MTARNARTTTRSGLAALVTLALLPAACGGVGTGTAPVKGRSSAITLYTCANAATVKAVITAFRKQHPGTTVQLFRAPTGELNARVAGDLRSGGLRADVIWACDPMTMQGYVKQGLVGGWTPADATGIPAGFRTPDAVGAALLYVVAVNHTNTPAPTSWSDLTTAPYRDAVAMPDPSLAASALGALGWFAAAPGYGLPFLSALHANGAVKLGTPDDVSTAVAQGTYRAGITISSSANVAKKAGSPINVVWPRPGAIAVFGPVALSRTSANAGPARDFISFLVSEQGQRVVGSTGGYPTRPGTGGPAVPAGASVVTPDWAGLAGRKDALLATFRQTFGG
jgi:iron(III) transport system substrate-binding protein